jgi:miniconductance mechanosensitive channel
VPSYDADGDVVNINLHTIKVRNFDMTYSIIPTARITEVPTKTGAACKKPARAALSARCTSI